MTSLLVLFDSFPVLENYSLFVRLSAVLSASTAQLGQGRWVLILESDNQARIVLTEHGRLVY